MHCLNQNRWIRVFDSEIASSDRSEYWFRRNRDFTVDQKEENIFVTGAVSDSPQSNLAAPRKGKTISMQA